MVGNLLACPRPYKSKFALGVGSTCSIKGTSQETWWAYETIHSG